MSEIVSASDIERIVGVSRHSHWHYARAVSAEQTVYILHSQRCLDLTADLRDCPYSRALDRGIEVEQWQQDAPTCVVVQGGHLVPVGDDFRSAAEGDAS